MINDKTISAVIFAYNEEKYISQMLDSITNQTTRIDKIIVVDDFSTDKTKNIIQQYQKHVPQIEYYLSEKKGKIYAYQTGLKKVETDLFFICAGDDVLMKDFAGKMFHFLEEKQIKFAYANYLMVDQNLSPFTSDITKKKLYYTCPELITYNHVSGYLFGYCSILKHILPLPEGLLFEDWYTSIKLSYIFSKIHIYPEPLFYYRRHSQASTAAYTTKDKYYYYLDRDIKLFESVLTENFISDRQIIKTIKSRILYLHTLRNYKFLDGLKNSLNESLTLKERSKLLLFPLYFGLKYK
jgi:glycosyltransferase involved in cell wall biosynthesis